MAMYLDRITTPQVAAAERHLDGALRSRRRHDLPVRLRRTRVSLTSQQLPKSLRRNGARRQYCGRGSDEQNAPQWSKRLRRGVLSL